MPAIQKVYQEYQPQGLKVLALNTAYQDSLANTQAFVQEHALTFPILLDTDGKASAKYQVNALPSTYFIGRDGVIQAVVIGGPISEAVLRANIIELLREDN
jgi:peroxiredoxin